MYGDFECRFKGAHCPNIDFNFKKKAAGLFNGLKGAELRFCCENHGSVHKTIFGPHSMAPEVYTHLMAASKENILHACNKSWKDSIFPPEVAGTELVCIRKSGDK